VKWFLKLFQGDDWKRVFAWIVVYGYAYDVVIWPLTFWLTTIGTAVTGAQWPGPPLVPWEQLAVMTANLAVIGGIQMLRDRRPSSISTETESSKETVVVKGG
jgi:hypothetical protein